MTAGAVMNNQQHSCVRDDLIACEYMFLCCSCTGLGYDINPEIPSTEIIDLIVISRTLCVSLCGGGGRSVLGFSKVGEKKPYLRQLKCISLIIYLSHM
jgi:hypothetical protein